MRAALGKMKKGVFWTPFFLSGRDFVSRRANFNRTVLAISGKIVHDKEEELWGPKERQKEVC